MGLFDGINISASGLTAQRLRMDVIANNIANAQSTRSVDNPNEPYRRQRVIFSPVEGSGSFASVLGNKLQSPGLGVAVTAVEKDMETPFKLVYDPSHPDAVKDPNDPGYGYVRMPNVDVTAEMVDMIAASRGYEANVTAVNAAKAMALKALEIGR
ncbi:flagellar basal body rod protein FlgC [Effusibacillus lacus]|uniref:Flagellar basal-body rod protein FlgC n=1 Tax=Effusibacillus lacus TaxID=1348429 RepID=A0A292YSP2_9BACL|nr:flagellar basal body rod protein FlgC [Effusibacillus lacus]TCS76037.1 flagellar basal-body rod protein FlgC [Effusibacillus lacus]GAX91444.1 flagellar basal-body rod protein FlgC [Effusibacillus lacus]